MIVLLLISFFVLLALGFPIAVALGLSSVLGLLVHQSIPLVVVIQRMFVAVDSFPLMAVPLYMLAANLMGCGGISRRIIEFCDALVGHLTGGLAHVNILASMIFAGISGSAVADTAGIGKILIPHMIEDKYPRPYSVAVTAISSTIGIVIPPSIPMVIIGAMIGVSVGKLFLGGIVPGLLIGFALMFTAFLLVRKDTSIARGERLGLRQVLKSSIHAVWSILMPVIVIGGIVLGVFTPTEAGAVAVAYAFIVGTVVYRELTPRHIMECLWQTALSTAKVFFIIAAAGLYTWLLTASGFPPLVGSLLLSITRSQTVMMAVIVLILIAITTFMESIATLILLLPILYPVALQVGIDPVYLGVMIVISIGIGLVTPPVGLCLYIAADIGQVSVSEATRALLPFILTIVVILGVLLFVPELILFVPEAVLGRG